MVDSIKKLMGWCPNANMIKSKEIMAYGEMAVNAPDGKRYPAAAESGWWSRYRNRRLLLSAGFMLFAISLFFEGGINNIDIFLAGLFIGIVAGFLELQSGLKALNKMALQGNVNYSKKARIAIVITIISFPVLFWYSRRIFGMEETLAFTSGFIILIWIKYFEIVYWERKHRKIMIIDKTSFYAVNK